MQTVVPWEKYPEIDWQASDKVATRKVFKCHIKVIFLADQVPAERQYALIFVVGGVEAFNCWNTLEDQQTPRIQNRYGMHTRKLYFGISEMLI